MQEVQVGSAERRDLILLRNQLVTLLRASQNVVMSAEDCQQIAAPALPPPINHHSACSKCPYLTICSSALRLAFTLTFHTLPQVRVVCFYVCRGSTLSAHKYISPHKYEGKI